MNEVELEQVPGQSRESVVGVGRELRDPRTGRVITFTWEDDVVHGGNIRREYGREGARYFLQVE